MKMAAEDWGKVLPARATVVYAITVKMEGHGVKNPLLADELATLFLAAMEDHYARGARGVQQDIIRALDLRLLLGVDARG